MCLLTNRCTLSRLCFDIYAQCLFIYRHYNIYWLDGKLLGTLDGTRLNDCLTRLIQSSRTCAVRGLRTMQTF